MEGVLRRGSSRACHTRLVVSMLIMSEDAKSDRPQVAAIGCRCMNSSTAWQSRLRRRSSRAQRMVRRMLVADNCGIMRAHSTAVRLVPWYDAGIDHQQLVGRARLTSEHDPAKAHLGVNGRITSGN